MKIFSILLFCFTVAIGIAEVPPLIHYPNEGFSIRPLEPGIGHNGYQILNMLMPPEDGFSSNVNIQKQEFIDTLSIYKELSDSQFREYGLEVITSEQRGDHLIFEYEGDVQGFDLHFYAKALKQGRFIYIATAAILVSQWPGLELEVTEVVESFALD